MSNWLQVTQLRRDLPKAGIWVGFSFFGRSLFLLFGYFGRNVPKRDSFSSKHEKLLLRSRFFTA